MEQLTYSLRTFIILPLAMCLLFWASASSKIPTRSIVTPVARSLASVPKLSRKQGKEMQTNCKLLLDEFQRNQSHTSQAAKYAIYAILSNNVYKRVFDELFCLPREWRPVEEFTLDALNGLSMRVFEKLSDGKPVEVVIAFRGTDDRKDWAQNLLSTHLFPKKTQVNLATDRYERIFAHYNKANPPPRFVATGHSLGGGLALHLSWIKPNVTAIAFNSSPREQMGFKKNRQTNTRVIIWEKSEVLQIPRKTAAIIGKIFGVRDDRETIEFDFQPGKKKRVRQHSMYALARNLLSLAGESASSSDRKLVQSLLDLNCPSRCH